MFVKCPSCAQSLPQGTAQCQFCDAPIAVVAGPKNVWHQDGDYTPYRRPKWVVPAYYVISGYFVVSGAITAIQALTAKQSFLTPILLVIAAINVILGVGLIAKVEFIRGIVNFVCGIGLILNGIGLFTSVPTLMLAGFTGLLMVFRTVFDMICEGTMIYLIGETD